MFENKHNVWVLKKDNVLGPGDRGNRVPGRYKGPGDRGTRRMSGTRRQGYQGTTGEYKGPGSRGTRVAGER